MPTLAAHHPADHAAAPVVDVSPAEAWISKDTARIIDVREPHEWIGELGHIPGATLVPLATLEAAAAQWDRERPVVVVCRSGSRSTRAAVTLAALGFRQVRNLAGGMLAYKGAGLPVVRGRS
ncbi:MAG TPA: rhodanese-like domain-containing protein [Polyangia bacterium]